MTLECAPDEIFGDKKNAQIFYTVPIKQSKYIGNILYVAFFQCRDERLGGNIPKLQKWLSLTCGILSDQRKMLNYFCDVFLICNINVSGTFCIYTFVSIIWNDG